MQNILILCRIYRFRLLTVGDVVPKLRGVRGC